MAHLISSITNNKRELMFVQSDVRIRQVVELMTNNRIGAMLVKDEDLVLGVISERDIVYKVVQPGLNPDEVTAKEIVYSRVSILDKHEPIEKAMQVISDTKRRHVLIAEEGRIIDIISIGDLMKHILAEKSQTIEHLEHYIYS